MSDNQKKTKAQILQELQMFHGSETIYYNPLFRESNYTEGAKFVFDECEATWLSVDILAYIDEHCRGEEFVNIVLTVENNTADLIFDDGNGNVIFKHHYNSTDFPLDKIQFFYENSVLHLPSER